MRILNVAMLILFTVAAVVQYDDPDPYLWMAIYGIGALCCLLYLLGSLPSFLSGLVAAGCLISGLYLLALILFGPNLFFDTTGTEMMGLMEETREMMGFLITGGWTAFLTWRVGRESATRSEPSPST